MLDQKSRVCLSVAAAYRPTQPTTQPKKLTSQPNLPPPVYQPTVRARPVQRKVTPAPPPSYQPFNSIQMKACKTCGKEKGHYSNCPLHQHNRGVVREEQQTRSEENTSWRNMQRYRPGWVRSNDITEEKVKAFCKQYSERRIRGHASEDGDTDQREQANTTTDLAAYKSWHTAQWGWV